MSRISEFGLKVVQESRKDRQPGWSKLHSSNQGESSVYEKVSGAINIEWDGDTRILLCRSIGKRAPVELMTRLVHYLLAKHGRKIEAINIMPR
jgi:hypothetical protein